MCWLPFREANQLDIPEITRTIIKEAEAIFQQIPPWTRATPSFVTA